MSDDFDHLLPLMIELTTSAMVDAEEDFVATVRRRLDEDLHSQEAAYFLISAFAAFAGHVVQAWADDTDREPSEVMQPIALQVAEDLYTDGA